MTATIYSGKDAFINGLSCVQSWQATEAVTAQRYSASCTPGATNVAPGIVNWSGQATGLGAYPVGALPTGIDVSFQGVINNTSMALKSLAGSILFEQLTIDIDKATYAQIKWTATFGAQGLLTEAATGAADSGSDVGNNSKDLAIILGDDPGGDALAQSLTKAQIVLRRPSTTYVDAGATKRKAGNLECDINFTVQESSLAVTDYAKNVLDIVNVMVGGGAYWQFKKIRFLGKSNYTVDRTSTNILGYQVNGQWNSNVLGDLGWITYFDGDDFNDFYGDSTP